MGWSEYRLVLSVSDACCCQRLSSVRVMSLEMSIQHVVMIGFVNGNCPLGEGGSIRRRWGCPRDLLGEI